MHICLDSIAALKALQSMKVKSKPTLTCHNKLNSLAVERILELLSTPRLRRTSCDDIADDLGSMD